MIKGKHYFLCKKLERGYVIVFDYRLNDCYNKGDDLVLQYRDKEMTISYADLKKKALKFSRMIYQSQFSGGRSYGVYHFKWQPTEEKIIKMPTLFDKVDIK